MLFSGWGGTSALPLRLLSKSVSIQSSNKIVFLYICFSASQKTLKFIGKRLVTDSIYRKWISGRISSNESLVSIKLLPSWLIRFSFRLVSTRIRNMKFVERTSPYYTSSGIKASKFFLLLGMRLSALSRLSSLFMLAPKYCWKSSTWMSKIKSSLLSSSMSLTSKFSF